MNKLDHIQTFIEENFKVKIKKRSKDTLMTLHCPICGDNKKVSSKGKTRTSFIRTADNIHYNCFNCNKVLSISDNINDFAFLLSREKEIPFPAAKMLLASLVKFYLDKPPTLQETIVKDLKKLSCPGGALKIDGAKWLLDRGFEKEALFKTFRQKDDKLFYPFTVNGSCFGYQEISINNKWYKNVTGPNELNDQLIGLDNIVSITERVLIVESVLDALLITQDSDNVVAGVALAGVSLGPSRIDILTKLEKQFIINTDNDETGLRLLDKLAKNYPTWLGSLTPSPYKDYGEYRKELGGIAALSKLVGSAKPLSSAALQLMRII